MWIYNTEQKEYIWFFRYTSEWYCPKKDYDYDNNNNNNNIDKNKPLLLINKNNDY